MIKKLFIVLIFGLLIAGCGSQEEQVEEKSVPVKIYKVKPESISQYIKLTGAVTASEDAVIYSKVSEKLDKIFVKPGDNVSASQVLAAQYNATLEQSVKLAEASIRSADANLKLVNLDYDRMIRLYEQKAISPQQFDQAKTQKETAEAAFEQTKLQLDQAKEQFENSFIKAPFAGVVAAIYFDKDQMVPAGQPVAQVISKSGIKSKLKVSVKDISFIKLSQKVKIKFPSIPNQEYSGVVTEINQALDPASRLLEVQVKLTNPDSKIKSGIFGEFLIAVFTKENTLAIPESAILHRTEITINKETGIQETIKKYYVFLIENQKAALKEIKTGISSNGRVEVPEGLNVSDSVIVVGQNIVREGQVVRVIE